MKKDDSSSFIHTKRNDVQYRNHSILVVGGPSRKEFASKRTRWGFGIVSMYSGRWHTLWKCNVFKIGPSLSEGSMFSVVGKDAPTKETNESPTAVTIKPLYWNPQVA
jgi:hypothetical protein